MNMHIDTGIHGVNTDNRKISTRYMDRYFAPNPADVDHKPLILNHNLLRSSANGPEVRLKVEVNTREHLAVLDFNKRPFPVKSRWYSRAADTTTFELDELLATKMRALYQRRKGRDLFDLTMGLEDRRSDAGRITAAFREYMNRESGPVSRAMYERNLAGKIVVAQFNADMSALLRPGIRVATGGRCTDHVGTADPPPSGRTLEAGGERMSRHRHA